MGDFDTAVDSVEYLRVYSDPRFALDRYREVLVEDSFLHRPVVVAGRASNGSLLHGVPVQAVDDQGRGGNVFFPAGV